MYPKKTKYIYNLEQGAMDLITALGYSLSDYKRNSSILPVRPL